MDKLVWTGLDEKEFRRYKSWINKKNPGICGSYCAAVLTHFTVFKDTGHWMSKKDLIDSFEILVDAYHLHQGTFYWNVASGLNMMFNYEHYRAKSGLMPDLEVPKLIDQYQQPVIVGTLKYLGSPYKNHWLLVYAYAYDQENNLYFKAYDNHGKIDAVIPADQTNTYVYLEPIKSQTNIDNNSPVTANTTENLITIKSNQAREIFLEKKAKEEKAKKERQIFGKEWDEWKDMII